MPKTSVSVVIGAYNAEAWIRQTLDSVLAQSCPVDEIIVVDDGSSDATRSVVQSYGRTVHLLAEEHRGRPHRNRGIAASSGDLVAFVDADDWWQPTKIEKQIDVLIAQNAEWALCDTVWFDAATDQIREPVGARVRGGDILESLFLNNFIVASTPLVRRRALETSGYFDESTDVAPVEDWDLWLRLAARSAAACVDEPLATLRLHDDSFLAATPLERRVQSQETVIQRAVARERARLGPLRRTALSNVYHAAGVGLFRRQQTGLARSFFLKAWRHQPSRLESLAYALLSLLGTRASMTTLRMLRRPDRGTLAQRATQRPNMTKP